ncbi:MAG: enoyl-CoA hydratase/isomerase family protein [Ignavibacteria bacterium]|nr:MAG: enoyl-CoA hydratase/isomerase family protein [Ignavibacteria bacterium]
MAFQRANLLVYFYSNFPYFTSSIWEAGMKNLVEIEFSSDSFSSKIVNNFAVVTLKGNAFINIADVTRTQDFLPWFDTIESNKELKGIVVVNEKGSMDENAYAEFLSNLTGEEIKPGERKNIEKFTSRDIRALEINMLSNLIRRISLFTKFFIVAFKDDAVTPFIGVSLAADFRVMSDSAKFSFSHAYYGLPASGALPFFLPKYVTQTTAFELCSVGGELNWKEVSELGLVNRVFPEDSFDEKLNEFTSMLGSLPSKQIRNSKILFYRNIGQLEDYLNFERQYLI